MKRNILTTDKSLTLRIHFIGLLLIILFYGIMNPINALLFGGIVNFIIYLTIGYLEAKKDKLIFNPISFYFLWYPINLGLSAIYSATVLATDGYINFSTARVDSHSVALGYLIFVTGSFALHIGLQFNRPTSIEQKTQNKIRIDKTVFVYFIILGLIFEFYSQYFDIFGGLFSFLRFSMITALVLVAFNPNNFLKVSMLARRNILIIGSIFVFLLNIETTSKAYMMFAFFPLLWFMIYYKIDRFKLVLVSFFFVFLYFLFVFPLSYELRTNYLFKKEIDVTSSIEKVLEGKTTAFDPQVRDRHPVYSYLSRSFDAIAVSYLTDQVNNYGFRYGETMAYMTYSLVPRLFWQNKPSISQAAWFTYYLGFAPSPEKATAALGITAIGELYWNFGIPGVILGMLIVGLGFSGLWRLAGKNPHYSIVSMLLYINILFGMPNMSEFGSVITTFVLTYLVFKSAYFIRDKFILQKFAR